MEQKYTTASDVWALGVLCWEAFTLGLTPFDHTDWRRLIDFFQAGKRLPRPKQCPAEVYAVMMLCWEFEPKDRPSITTIINKLTEIQLAGWDNMDQYITPSDDLGEATETSGAYCNRALTTSSSATKPQEAFRLTRAAWEYDDVKV